MYHHYVTTVYLELELLFFIVISILHGKKLDTAHGSNNRPVQTRSTVGNVGSMFCFSLEEKPQTKSEDISAAILTKLSSVFFFKSIDFSKMQYKSFSVPRSYSSNLI